jgi:hypothetical protein
VTTNMPKISQLMAEKEHAEAELEKQLMQTRNDTTSTESNKSHIKSLIDNEIKENSSGIAYTELNDLLTNDLEIAREFEAHKETCRAEVFKVKEGLQRLRKQRTVLELPFDPALVVEQLENYRKSTIESHKRLVEAAGKVMTGYDVVMSRAGQMHAMHERQTEERINRFWTLRVLAELCGV